MSKTIEESAQEMTKEEYLECWNEAIKDESLQLFQQETSSILTQLAQAEDTYKKLSEQRDKLKAQLLEAMDKYSLDKWENDKFSITYVKGKFIGIELKTDKGKASIRFKVK
jgi:histone deacetylase complex regulatory component SIN3